MVKFGVESENGWRPARATPDILEWVTVPGTSVRLQFMKGWPSAILRAYAADYNAYIEPLRDADSASFTPTNSVATSNHLNATAMDLNWQSHPFRERGTFTPAQMVTMRELLDFYESIVFWAGDWQDPIDEMHVQLNYETFGDPRLGDFIKRKIRPDGFSTFRRDNQPQSSAALILSRAAGLSLEKAQEILPTLTAGLQLAECNTPLRIAMALAQWGHESDSFSTTTEYASGDAYDTRTDLGNTPQVDGDGRLYKGRSWGQITGKSNYRAFSSWAFNRGLIPSPVYFVDNPLELSELRWAGTGAAWYWLETRRNRRYTSLNAASDAGDVTTATQIINGGLTNLDDRQARYDRALALGDQLLTLLDDGDLMTIQITRQEWDDLVGKVNQIHREVTEPVESLSWLRKAGEGAIGNQRTIIRNGDLMKHFGYVLETAKLGDFDAIKRFEDVAEGRGATDSEALRKLAKRALAQVPVEYLTEYQAQK